MLALVILEGVVVALLAFLVAGLLKSHAEILRRLHELTEGSGGRWASGDGTGGGEDHDGGQPDWLPGRVSGDGSAHDVVGVTPEGEAVAVSVAGASGNTLLAFLTGGCATCTEFWMAFRSPRRLGLPAGTRLVVVTRGSEAESVTALREIASPTTTVVMSTDAWERYRVPGAPYFVLVDGPAGAVAGEGTGTSWSQVQSLMRQALGDQTAMAERARRSDKGRHDVDDAALLAAGIGPGHPSLFPKSFGADDPEPRP